MNFRSNPDGSRTMTVSESESQAYLLLGLLASLAGRRELMDELKNGNKSLDDRIAGGMTGWNAGEIPSDEMSRMEAFRHALVHGLCIVAEDGGIFISDEKYGEDDSRSHLSLSLVELQEMAGAWVEWLAPPIVIDRYMAAGHPHPIQVSITPK